MIDTIDNGLQLSVLLLCAVIALVRATSKHSRTWTLTFFYFGSWLLGDLYWSVCLFFFEETPQISVVSDLSWYASFLFLYLLLRETDPAEEIDRKRLLPWLGPIVAAAMAIFFMLWGEIVSNLIYGALMGLLLFASIRRLERGNAAGGRRFLSAWILIYCLLVYALWTASCYWDDSVPFHPYYVFDLLITLSFPFLLWATKKAVA